MSAKAILIKYSYHVQFAPVLDYPKYAPDSDGSNTFQTVIALNMHQTLMVKYAPDSNSSKYAPNSDG